jgi:hypothetical protein
MYLEVGGSKFLLYTLAYPIPGIFIGTLTWAEFTELIVAYLSDNYYVIETSILIIPNSACSLGLIVTSHCIMGVIVSLEIFLTSLEIYSACLKISSKFRVKSIGLVGFLNIEFYAFVIISWV